jgi:hypothetical protein
MISETLEEKSPITGKDEVIVELSDSGLLTKLCMGSGYYTDSSLALGSDNQIQYESTLPRICIDKRHIDLDNCVWYPFVFSLDTAVIFPDEGENRKLVWKVCAIVDFTKDDLETYPNAEIQRKVDVDNAFEFEATSFREAFEKLFELNAPKYREVE